MFSLNSANSVTTRMHSSRMCTGRSLTVCCSLLPGGGVPGPGGCAWSGGDVPGLGGWCLVRGGVPGLGGGVPAPGGAGGGIPACTEADTLPPVDRILDTCL